MEELDLDTNVLEFGSGDMSDIWGPSQLLDTGLSEGDGEMYSYLDCRESVVLRDRMITDASLPIQTEHSYCNANPLALQPGVTVKREEGEEDEMENECFPAISMSTATSAAEGDNEVTVMKRRPEPAAPAPAPAPAATAAAPAAAAAAAAPATAFTVKSEPGSPSAAAWSAATAVPRRLVLSQARSGVQVLRTAGTALHTVQQMSAGHSVLRPQTIVVTAARQVAPCRTVSAASSDLTTRLSVKIEPSSVFSLPPTPPSSDDGGSSPTHAGSLVSPVRAAVTQRSPRVVVTGCRPAASRHPINSPLISSQLHKGIHGTHGTPGTLNLTAEEKRTLVSEGYSIPSRWPLTKSEERSLKKIRRKIKNKISAQESRRKKKEYMDTLEQRLDVVAVENDRYQARLAELESEHHKLGSRHGELEARNTLLLRQLRQLQLLVGAAGVTEKLREQTALLKAVK